MLLLYYLVISQSLSLWYTRKFYVRSSIYAYMYTCPSSRQTLAAKQRKRQPQAGKAFVWMPWLAAAGQEAKGQYELAGDSYFGVLQAMLQDEQQCDSVQPKHQTQQQQQQQQQQPSSQTLDGSDAQGTDPRLVEFLANQALVCYVQASDWDHLDAL